MSEYTKRLDYSPVAFDLQLFAEGDESDASAGSVTPQSSGDNGESGGDVDEYDGGDSEGEELAEEDAGAEAVDQPPTGRKSRQDPETDAHFARLRREKEAAAREAQTLRAERDAWVRDNFGSTHGLFTWDQYTQAVARERQQAQMAEAKKYEEELRENLGIDPSLIHGLIQNNPVVQSLRQENEQARQEKFYRFVADQFEELKKEAPEIKTPDDVDQDTWIKFNRGQSGISLADAYFAVHRKELLSRTRSSGEKTALRNIASKDHLGTEKPGGSGNIGQDVTLNDEELKVWRAFGYKDTKDIKNRKRKFLGLKAAK